MATAQLQLLPDELVEAIVVYLSPDATLAFANTCKRFHTIAYEHLVWLRHCVQGWRYWEPRHELAERLQQPPASTKWRQLYNQRRMTDNKAREVFEQLLLTQQHRVARIEEISKLGYDVKDLMMQLRDETPDDAEDVLARRYHADMILGQIHRMTAVEKWNRLHLRRMVRLEEVLGAYDLFVLSGNKGDLNDIDQELDRIARAVRTSDAQYEDFSIRRKVLEIVKYLREHELVGNPIEEDYHALRNNFIGVALFHEPHTSLPLQSVAIFCAVARRLGINARPSNYPSHIHAVVEAPADQTLDGRERTPLPDSEPETMYMDPWRSTEEIPREHLTLRLQQMGAQPSQFAAHLGAGSTFDLTMRTGRNIMNSVQETRDRQRGQRRASVSPSPDVEAAWYGMLWSLLILGENNAAATLHRRRQLLPYLADHFQNHYPEDLCLLETVVAPMFVNEREHQVLMHLINTARTADRNAKAPKSRAALAGITGRGLQRVEYKIGQHFQHKRYGYEGVVVGWDFQCSADPRWIHQMRVDDLPRGREQPFYNVIGEDKSQRYVAEENIDPLSKRPGESLMQLAGRYFKRWDDEQGLFVSNVRDEYPDD